VPEEKTKTARTEIARLRETAQPLMGVVAERDYWAKVIADLNQRIPKDYIWITSLEITAEEQKPDDSEPERKPAGKSKSRQDEGRTGPAVVLMARGLYLGREARNVAGPAVVDEFIAELKKSDYVVPVEDPNRGYRRANNDTNDWAFGFDLPLELKKPIAIP